MQPWVTRIVALPPDQLTVTVPCRPVDEFESTAIVTSPVLCPLDAPTGWIQASDVDTVHRHPLTVPVFTEIWNVPPASDIETAGEEVTR
jgi:hypothetical protein